MDEWISVKDDLPTKETRYAGEYGVSVLIFDFLEPFGDRPYEASFKFDDNWFVEYQTTKNGKEIKIFCEATHWRPLPEKPECFKEEEEK